MVVTHGTPSVRPDDVLAALRPVADLVPPVPPQVTRLARGDSLLMLGRSATHWRQTALWLAEKPQQLDLRLFEVRKAASAPCGMRSSHPLVHVSESFCAGASSAPTTSPTRALATTKGFPSSFRVPKRPDQEQ